jgi:hypothetical protein
VGDKDLGVLTVNQHGKQTIWHVRPDEWENSDQTKTDKNWTSPAEDEAKDAVTKTEEPNLTPRPRRGKKDQRQRTRAETEHRHSESKYRAANRNSQAATQTREKISGCGENWILAWRPKCISRRRPAPRRIKSSTRAARKSN